MATEEKTKKPAAEESEEYFCKGHYEPHHDLVTLNIHGGVIKKLAGKTIQITDITGPSTFGIPRTNGNPHALEPTIENGRGLRIKFKVLDGGE